MAFEFKLPEIGEGVTEGEVVKWLVKKGDKVKEDQPIVEVMTDKATVEIASPRAGKILAVLAKEGETVKIGKGLASIEDNGVAPAPTKTAPVAAPAPAAPAPVIASSSHALAAPATRKLAREMGIDLNQIRGTGPGGRITQEDLKRPAPSLPVTPKGSDERIPLRGIRKKIAERMRHSLDTAAHFTHVDEVDMTEVVALRESLKAQAAARGTKLTYLPFVIRAVTIALREFPRLNSSLDDEKGEIVVKHDLNIGVAVNTKENDLIVPVVRNAGGKSILNLASELATLSDKARNNLLTPAELTGGTFTITSVGSIGGLFATPIINFPEAAILGFYQIQERPVVRDGAIVIRKMAYLSISVDHRIVDGAMGASFLVSVKRNLEDPKHLFNLLDA